MYFEASRHSREWSRSLNNDGHYKISYTDPRFYRDPVVIGPRDGDIAPLFLDKIISDANELREIYKT